MLNQKIKKASIVGITVLLLLLIPILQNVKAIDNVPDGLEFRDHYRIDEFNENPYRYDEDWKIYVDKGNGNELTGFMSLFRPVDPDLSNKSRAFAHKSTLYAWGAAMGGNPTWVRDNLLSNPSYGYHIREDEVDGETFIRYYIRDIAALSGVAPSGVEVHENTIDGNTGYIVIKPTPFPTAEINAPQKATAGEEFIITINGEEFEPSSRNKITFEIYADGSNQPIKSGVKFVNKLSDFNIPITLNTTGTRTLTVRITDRVERTTSASTVVNVVGQSQPDPEPEPEPEPEPNIPPEALVYVEPSFYWVEEVPFQDHSYDIDGEIVFSEFRVDGEPSQSPKKFSRVTQEEQHSVEVMVVDDKGDSDSHSKEFKILPTTPTAEFSITGTIKENRQISLDGTLSDRTSPVHVAPIVYSLSQWNIRPLTEGVLPSDILIRTSSDKSKRDFLVRKAGEYEISLTVTNTYGETSKPVTKRIIVEPDKPPIAKFTADTAKAIRDKNDNKHATITLTDASISEDEDVIKQRIYYVEFDSNNDGFFGTPLDEPKKIISNTNETVVRYKTSKVGNYRFSMEIVEGFGQPTLPEFIQDEHYRRDTTGVIDETGSVSTYQDPSNFNRGLYDTSVEVINVSPIIDFGVRRKNSIDVVLNFGGMDTATQQHLTGSRPGSGTNNGGGGGTYDHRYFIYDELDKNRLSSYASTLQANLLAKGIDASVTIDNSYFKQADPDGVGVRNVPYWDWVDHGSYQYDSYTGTSPYSGSWEVVSSSETPIYETVVVWCYYSRMVWSDAEQDYVEYVIEHAPPCDMASNEVTDTVQVGTTYSASLRKYFPDWRFEVTHYYDTGVSATEQVNTTDFTDAYINRAYRPNTQRLYLRMDKHPWNWMGNTSKVSGMINKTSIGNIYLWNKATALNKFNAETIINGSIGQGQFNIYDNQNLFSNVKDVENYIINKYFIEEDGVNTTIVLGDQLDYTTEYTDHENDPELKREWKFTHDPTKINNRVIDNAPSSPVPQSGLYIDSPMQLTEVGTYKVQLRAQDDPVYDGDERFFNYRKWSDEEVQREYTINVHRRPIADFRFTIDPGTLSLSLDPTTSYDPDHQFNRDDKGIVEYKWDSYVLDGVTYNGQPPSTLTVNKFYDVTLQVKDIDGAYGVVTKRISTHGYNIKPIALFDAPDMVVNTQALNIVDRSYDPNGDPLTDYQITIRRQGNSTILRTLTSFPNSFGEMGLGEGNYVIGLTVKDIPRVPPQLTSDLYERNIKVIENRPPVSQFALSPNPLLVNEMNTYADQSYDPDGHALKNYSWTIEKLGSDNSVLQAWNTGVAPRDWREYGIGTFRVTQTVFDEPPYPLPSLSDSHSILVDVVLGPQRPFAIFDFLPSSPIEGNTIQLNPDRSFDLDGTINGWEWSIKAPNGTITTSTSEYPMIPNAMLGTYEVSLYVLDNDNLRSRVPSVQTIIVRPIPPNIPPVANFVWNPYLPLLGENIHFNPDSSYDVDGTIVDWKWTFVSNEGSTQDSSEKYPEITSASKTYQVTLEVTDDKGAKGFNTQTVNVNIAWLISKVTHTPEWSQRWVNDGYEPDVNIFYAGEQFVIELTSSPANRVWGEVHFGSDIGLVEIPSSEFQLVSTSPFEYKWRAKLWQPNFVNIPEGEYMFEFYGMHPVVNPILQSTDSYLVEIRSNIYDAKGFHRNY